MIVCDKDNFEVEVLQGEGYVIVDYYGDRCAPCEALMPHVVELSETYGDKFKFCKVNVVESRRLAISQKIMGIPVVALYKDGKKIEELVKEEATRDNIEKMIKSYI